VIERTHGRRSSKVDGYKEGRFFMRACFEALIVVFTRRFKTKISAKSNPQVLRYLL